MAQNNNYDDEPRGLSTTRQSNEISGAVIGTAAEKQRAIAEIQAALMVAKGSPRNEIKAVDRIKTACQRVGLAEKAEYVYSRGGTDITGPTIDLLTVVSNCWGNIQSGFRELLQADGESTVEAFAWDLETNTKKIITFTVPHVRYTRTGSYDLTDPRDIYELVANNAQRRVRRCLEDIIPPDVVEDAVTECRNTLKTKVVVNAESIGKLVEAFARFGVSKEQIESRLARRLDAMQPAQFVNLRKIWKSLDDGMSKASDWFQDSKVGESDLNDKGDGKGNGEGKQPQSEAQALKSETTPPKTEQAEPARTESPKTETTAPAADPKNPSGLDQFKQLMPTAKTQRDWERLKDRFIGEKRKVTCTADEEKEIWKLYKEGIDKVTAKSGPTGQQALV